MRAGEPLIDWVGRAILVLGVAAVLTAGFVGTWTLAGSVGLGVGLAWGNLWLLRNLARRMVDGGAQGRTVGLLFIKFLLPIGLFFAITRWLALDVLGLMGGFSTGVLAILGGTYLGPPSDGIAVKASEAGGDAQGTPPASQGGRADPGPPSGRAG